MLPIRAVSPIICNHFAQKLKKPFAFTNNCRHYSQNNSNQIKVTLCGAAGHVGQPLSLMLKQSPLIDELALYDLDGTTGLALELGHIDTKCKVSAYSHTLHEEAFTGAQVVIAAAASPRTSFKDMNKSFEPNACVVRELMEYGGLYCPNAIFAIATNPVDSLLPLASEVLKLKGVYNPSKVLGVTAIDVVRANTFVADLFGLEPECVTVPVIGGHCEDTIVPLLSHAKPCADFTVEEIEKLTKAIRTAHNDIIKIKGNEAPTLSTSFAIARFIISILKGLKGQSDVIECAFVRTDVHPATKYLAIPVQLGPGGIQKQLGLPELSEYEGCLLSQALPIIGESAKRAKTFLGIPAEVPCDACDSDPKAPLCPEDWCEKRKTQTLHDL